MGLFFVRLDGRMCLLRVRALTSLSARLSKRSLFELTEPLVDKCRSILNRFEKRVDGANVRDGIYCQLYPNYICKVEGDGKH